jgi:hypothetical protein
MPASAKRLLSEAAYERTILTNETAAPSATATSIYSTHRQVAKNSKNHRIGRKNLLSPSYFYITSLVKKIFTLGRIFLT